LVDFVLLLRICELVLDDVDVDDVFVDLENWEVDVDDVDDVFVDLENWEVEEVFVDGLNNDELVVFEVELLESSGPNDCVNEINNFLLLRIKLIPFMSDKATLMNLASGTTCWNV
jgi:hypothetical protein